MMPTFAPSHHPNALPIVEITSIKSFFNGLNYLRDMYLMFTMVAH